MKTSPKKQIRPSKEITQTMKLWSGGVCGFTLVKGKRVGKLKIGIVGAVSECEAIGAFVKDYREEYPENVINSVCVHEVPQQVIDSMAT